MSLKGQTIKTAPFPEFVAVTSSLAKNPSYDIIIAQENTLDNYCFALLEKTFAIRQSQIPAFVNYQTTLVKDPITWLNKFEKLLANNEDLFASKRVFSRFYKLYTLIEKKRTELQSSSVKETAPKTPKRLINAESEDRHFSFHEVKLHIEALDVFGDKILYLTEEIFEYRQADIISLNNKLQEFDKQCEQLIEKLQTMRKMRAEFEKEQQELFGNQTPFKKIRFNGNLNQLVDVFFQMSRELFVNGKPLLDGTNSEIADVVVNMFLDKDGNEISKPTVETILKPSKFEKRPKLDSRIDVDKMI